MIREQGREEKSKQKRRKISFLRSEKRVKDQIVGHERGKMRRWLWEAQEVKEKQKTSRKGREEEKGRKMGGGQNETGRQERSEGKNTEEREGYAEVSPFPATWGDPVPLGGCGEMGQEIIKPPHFLGALSPIERWNCSLGKQLLFLPGQKEAGMATAAAS